MNGLAYCLVVLVGLAASCFGDSPNPVIVLPGRGASFKAGDKVLITWKNPKVHGELNLELVNFDGTALRYPRHICVVSAAVEQFTWVVPHDLPSSTCYGFRMWALTPPAKGADAGLSAEFAIVNDRPAVSKFTVTQPDGPTQVAIGSNLTIAWDYPVDSITVPAVVNVRVYRVGEDTPAYELGTFMTALKSVVWSVPNDETLVNAEFYISVSSQYKPAAGPSASNDFGANGAAFKLSDRAAVAATTSSTSTSTSTTATSTTTSAKPTSLVDGNVRAQIVSANSGAGRFPAALVATLGPVAAVLLALLL